jgi:hypothetical protein
VSVSSRNRRVRIYAPASTLTDGLPATVYTRRSPGQWWASIEPPTGREKTTGLAADHTVTAVLTLASEAVIGKHDVVVDDADVIYEVRAILTRHAEQQVWLEEASTAQATYTLAVS